jgi:hypothetical protein
MMARKQPWYLELRAEALAIVLLTRRDDLLITRPKADGPVDLLVEIAPGRRQTGRVLAVQLKAQVEPLADAGADKRRPEAATPELGHSTLPTCAFLFTMQDERAYYAWAVEPVVSPEGRPGLEPQSHLELRALDREAVDRLVEQTDRWYDALSATLAA